MSTKPILFNAEMVRALLSGWKSVTRRVVKPQPKAVYHGGTIWDDEGCPVILVEAQNCRLEQITVPYRPGDILYVRETWCNANKPGIAPDYYYFADTKYVEDYFPPEWKWRPSIHMPKDAARLFLRVTNVRVERLQDITEEQAIAEGCSGTFSGTGESFGSGWIKTPQDEFAELWGSTIKKADLPLYGWSANPWTWVIEFERISKEEALKGGDPT